MGETKKELELELESNIKGDISNKTKMTSFSLFALGFRPFFFFAAILSVFIMSLSLVQFSGKFVLTNYYTSVSWHAHEMLFGYTVAVIAGFLFTAVGNWTGIKVIAGWQLILVSIVFLLGRTLVFVPDISHWLIALIDFIFIPLVTLIISVPIIRAKQWSNLIFIPLLLLMAVANLFVHLSVLGVVSIPVTTGSRGMLYLVVLLIVIMAGRVIPFFTDKAIKGATTNKWPWIERLSPISILFLLVADIVYDEQIIAAYLALLALVIHGVRLSGWYSTDIWKVPLVWVLHVAYSWFIFGFLIQSLAIIGFSNSYYSYHALTVGGIAGMTLGMMVRVSIGHTGRDMKVDNWLVLSFILLNVAALIRVILPLFFQVNYNYLIQVAGVFWIVSFTIFVVKFIPIWIRPRVDGREG